MRRQLSCAVLLVWLHACQSSTGTADSTTTPCDSSSVDHLVTCVDADRFHEDLVTVTGIRPPASPHWQEVQDLCAERLTALGFEVERQSYGTGVNVIGTLPGSDLASEHVVVSAHYDHIPDCAGADDNASGIAGVLELARVLSMGRYRRTAVIACWDEEERRENAVNAALGSQAYATRARQRDETITASWVFDGIGYARSPTLELVGVLREELDLNGLG